MRISTAFAAAVLAVAAPLAARAETASDFNLYVLHDMSMHSSDVEGRVAVGGDATLQSYSVGALVNPADVNFVVGGNFTGTWGSVTGSTLVGGAATLNGWGGSVSTGVSPLPVDFADENARLLALSDALAGLTANGTTDVQYCGAPGSHNCQVTLTGADTGLNIFDLSGAIAVDTNTFNINIAPGSTALINVSGTTNLFQGGGMYINGQFISAGNLGAASNVLWNFSDTTQLSLPNMAFAGSILAPNADYLGGWGVILGQVVVGDFRDTYGATQVNYVPFTGSVNANAVPEPATWALMIGGFGLAGAMLRRRRAALAAG